MILLPDYSAQWQLKQFKVKCKKTTDCIGVKVIRSKYRVIIMIMTYTTTT